MSRFILFIVLLFSIATTNVSFAQEPASTLENYLWETLRSSALMTGYNWDSIMGLGTNGVVTIAGGGGTSGTLNIGAALPAGYKLRQLTIIPSVVVTVTFTGSGINADTGANTVSITLPAGAHNIQITNATSMIVTNNTVDATDVYAYVMAVREKRLAP